MDASRVVQFGPFALNVGARRLTKAEKPVPLAERAMDLLLYFTAHPGRAIPKDELIQVVWGGDAVIDNNLVQVVRVLRRTLDGPVSNAKNVNNAKNGKNRKTKQTSCIRTVHRDGYRFDVPIVECDEIAPLAIDHALDAFEAFVEGQPGLESLNAAAIARWRRAFAAAVLAEPRMAAAHIGLANACLLTYESTRAWAKPDLDSLALAEKHAREACRLNRLSADAWSTLAVVLHRLGQLCDAIKAARKATALEPRQWRHDLRLAIVSSGVERLRAAERVIARCPEVSLAYWLAAKVFVACEEFDTALELLREGRAAQDRPRAGAPVYAAVGLDLMEGLILAARGETAAADKAWARELARPDTGHIYERESKANTWYARGAVYLREGRRDEAIAAFQEALTCVPGHALATVSLAFLSPESSSVTAARALGASALAGAPARSAMDVATVGAVILTLRGDRAEAARIYKEALLQSAGEAGWQLPIEPLIHVAAHRDVWADALSIVRARHL